MFQWKVNGVVMPAPDASSYGVDRADFDSDASGRGGEDGVMKRVVVRKRVEDIPMTFTHLTATECATIIAAIEPNSITVWINEDSVERTISAYVAKYTKKHAGWGSSGSCWSLNFNIVQN